jgi:hypothetical protein
MDGRLCVCASETESVLLLVSHWSVHSFEKLSIGSEKMIYDVCRQDTAL